MQTVQTLSLRQKSMLILIERQENGMSRAELSAAMPEALSASKVTLIRDLNALLAQQLISVTGQGQSTRYYARQVGQLLRYFDLTSYFNNAPDDRLLSDQSLDSFFAELASFELLSSEERARLDEANDGFRSRLAKRPPDILRREQERFTIELAWKSSSIEGNTYSLLETEELIKTAKTAPGHIAEEAQMILNHKAALDSIVAHSDDYRQLSIADLLFVHQLLVAGLGISEGIRAQPVGIIATNYLCEVFCVGRRRFLSVAQIGSSTAASP